MPHDSHPEIVKRLKRSEGHLRKVIEMIENGQPCTKITQQLYAVERAIEAAKSALIHDHVEHCLTEATDGPEERTARLAEFREITRYL